MDQNVQFVIAVGTVGGVFLWLRRDINLLNAKIDTVSDGLNARLDSVEARQGRMNDNIAALRESLASTESAVGASR